MTVQLRYTGGRPSVIEGRHVAPGTIVEVEPKTARYFLAIGEGELVAEPPADQPAPEHRDPAPVAQVKTPRRRRGQ